MATAFNTVEARGPLASQPNLLEPLEGQDSLFTGILMLITIITVPPKYIYFRFLLFELFYTHETGAIFNDSRI